MTGMYRQLKVCQIADRLVLQIYTVTASFPTTERFGITAQLRRAAAAIPMNIAEGNARGHRREYLQHCFIARGSIAEVEYILDLALALGFIKEREYEFLTRGYDEVGKMLQGLINKLATP